jgi:hypothetical protein
MALETIDGYESCTGNVGTECVWTIVAPTECALTTTDATTPVSDETTAAISSSDSRIRTSDEATDAEEAEYLCV